MEGRSHAYSRNYGQRGLIRTHHVAIPLQQIWYLRPWIYAKGRFLWPGPFLPLPAVGSTVATNMWGPPHHHTPTWHTLLEGSMACPQDARGPLWVDPSTDPRDPACLAWVTGWLDPPPAPTHKTQTLTQTNHTIWTNWVWLGDMAWPSMPSMGQGLAALIKFDPKQTEAMIIN
jgi:hypothetical protein